MWVAVSTSIFILSPVIFKMITYMGNILLKQDRFNKDPSLALERQNGQISTYSYDTRTQSLLHTHLYMNIILRARARQWAENKVRSREWPGHLSGISSFAASTQHQSSHVFSFSYKREYFNRDQPGCVKWRGRIPTRKRKKSLVNARACEYPHPLYFLVLLPFVDYSLLTRAISLVPHSCYSLHFNSFSPSMR